MQPFADLARAFTRFAETESQGMSPLYERLARGVAGDTDVLEIAAHSRSGQPAPNLLFGAARLLLEENPGCALAAFYPGLGNGRPQQADPYPAFHDFCLLNRDRIFEIISTRTVQSNVVRRSAVLLTGLSEVQRAVDDGPFAHIEIGASAGLTMLWDRWAYEFGGMRVFEDEASRPVIMTALRGSRAPRFFERLPRVVERVGVDLSPVDPADEAAMRWLEALIWPEHDDNRRLMKQAVAMARQSPPRVLAGDAVALLPGILSTLPAGLPVSVYHSHTVNQFSSGARAAFETVLVDASENRPVFRLSFEGDGPGHSTLRLIRYDRGRRDETHLANCEAHGRWVEWLT